MYIPNSFTPNDDERNQIFKVYGNGIVSLEVRIFNRWGQEIFMFADINAGWEGQTVSGVLCPQDTYVYRVNVLDVLNKTHQYTGMVNLIR